MLSEALSPGGEQTDTQTEISFFGLRLLILISELPAKICVADNLRRIFCSHACHCRIFDEKNKYHPISSMMMLSSVVLPAGLALRSLPYVSSFRPSVFSA